MSRFTTRVLVLCAAVGSVPATGLAATEEAILIEEITVTAQKREESIMDVPMSIQAFSGDRVQNSGIADMKELSAYVPNLIISESTITTNIYMRGVGSGINRSFEQSVGMFIDGIYMGRARQYRSPFFDLERVEVLRGPQGILFGKNTIAGTVNVITAKPDPDEEFNGYIQLEYEPEYKTRNINGVLSGSAGDTLGLRLAFKDSSSDGWVRDSFQNIDAPNTDERLVRLAFNWTPNDDWQVTGKVEHNEFNSVGYTLQSVGLKPLGALAAYTVAQIYNADPQFDTVANDLKSTDGVLADDSRDTEIDNAALNIEYALGEHTMTFVSGYSAYEYSDWLDADFSPITFLSTNDFPEYEQLSQEIRFATPGGRKFDYITGLYWQKNELESFYYSDINISPLAPFLQATYDVLGLSGLGLEPVNFSRTTAFDQETTTLSAFFQGTWSVTDEFRVILGGRYTHEEKDFFRESAITNFQNLATVGGVNEQVMAQVFQVAVLLPQYANKRSESHFTPSAKLQWDINDDVMFYATAENGFKSGGFNSNPDATVENQQFEEESALGLEVGVKSAVLDGRAQLNAAIFRTNYDDLQVTTWNGFGFVVGNAAESVSQGVELDGQIAVTGSLTMGGAIAYLDSYYKDFKTAGCPAETIAMGTTVCDLTGRPTTYAPKWSGSLFANHVYGFGNGIELRTGLDFNYSDDFYIDSDLDENLKQGAYYKINAHLALVGRDGRWEVALVGKNLNDETTVSVGLDQPLIAGGYSAFVDRPREIFVRLKLNF